MVTQRGDLCRILLVSPSALYGVELSELHQNRQRDCWPCQLVHCILNDTMDGQSILSLIILLTSYPIWLVRRYLLTSRNRDMVSCHSGDGQKPLPSRAEPFGLRHRTSNWNLLSGSPKKHSRARRRTSGSFWFFQKTSVLLDWRIQPHEASRYFLKFWRNL